MLKDKVYHKIVTAAQRGSIIHPWIVKTVKPEMSFDILSDSEGYDTLDAALCCAIFEVAKGEFRGSPRGGGPETNGFYRRPWPI